MSIIRLGGSQGFAQKNKIGNTDLVAGRLLGSVEHSHLNGRLNPLEFEVTRASEGSGIDQNGNIVWYAPFEPRYVWRNGVKRLLVEPERTNHYTNTNIQQAIFGGTVTRVNTTLLGQNAVDITTAIGGGITPTSGTNLVRLTNISFAIASNRTFVSSIIVKPTTATLLSMWVYGAGDNIRLQSNNINIVTGVCTFNHTTGVTNSFSGSIPLSDGAYLVYIGGTTTTAQTITEISFCLAVEGTNAIFSMPQFEETTASTTLVPTSRIRTSGGAVTRNADVIQRTGIQSLLGQTEGTLYAEIEITKITNANRNIFSARIGNTATYLWMYITSVNGYRLQARNNNGAETTLINVGTLTTGRHKIACRYKNGDYALAVDGVIIGTSNNTEVFPTNLSALDAGGGSLGTLNDEYIEMRSYNRGYSNDELIALTTLT